MIKAAIHGKANTPDTRDLVRLLLIHPDVQFIGFFDGENSGRPLWEDIPDIYGSCELRYSRTDLSGDIDVLFCTEADEVPAEALTRLENDPEFRLIVFAPKAGKESVVEGDERFVYGIPEINRKEMVRGARAVKLATAPAMALVDGLFPAARTLLLPADGTPLEVRVQGPKFDRAQAGREAELCLTTIQTSFVSGVHFQRDENPEPYLRAMTLDVEFPSQVDEEVIRETINNTYDDHNFTFLLPEGTKLASAYEDAPLAGSNKCFISVEKPSSEKVCFRVALDPRMKGGAGNAIHCMNLLFGLHEKTGLYLKPGE